MMHSPCLRCICALTIALSLLVGVMAGCKSTDFHAYSATYFDETFDLIFSSTTTQYLTNIDVLLLITKVYGLH